MPITNADIAAVFDDVADLLEVDGANAFRITSDKGVEIYRGPGHIARAKP